MITECVMRIVKQTNAMKYQQNADRTLQLLDIRKGLSKRSGLYTDEFTIHQSRFETDFDVRVSFFFATDFLCLGLFFLKKTVLKLV